MVAAGAGVMKLSSRMTDRTEPGVSNLKRLLKEKNSLLNAAFMFESI